MSRPHIKQSDEDIRMDYLVDSGFPVKDARQWIHDHPKPALFGEATAILSERMHELTEVMFHGKKFTSLPWYKKLWYRIRWGLRR